MNNYFLLQLISYSNLGYDIFITEIYGHSGLKMVKRYDYKLERSVETQQIIDTDKLFVKEEVNKILDFLYNDIKNQVENGTK